MPTILDNINRRLLNRFRQPDLKKLPEYGLLFFEHLQAEYAAQASEVRDEERKRLEEIVANKKDGSLTWGEVYTFDLIIARTLQGEKLRRKIRALRSLYRSVAGQKDYDAYMASKPPDPSEPGTPDEALKQDCLFLLDQFYLEYSMTSAKESMRNHLLKLAAFFALLTIALGASITVVNNKGWWGLGKGVTTLSVVIFAGVVGALVSMQQRIQASPYDGDSLHNFAMLTHGKFGIFLSPISGAIFAALLYLMFASGLLKGTFFPQVTTLNVPCPAPSTSATPSPSPSQPTTANAGAAANVGISAGPSNKVANAGTAAATPDKAAATTPGTAPDQRQQQPPAQEQDAQQRQTGQSIIALLHEFLSETGPCGGNNYALLVIWAFIAGFAERLVPDALNRLVAKSGS
jgi:hypothetical protein